MRWFGHVQRRAVNTPVYKSELIQVEGAKKGRGRPKITLIVVEKKDMSFKEVIESMISGRIE